ncbi:hypothetical protein MMC27_007014 [Xylographa pallens]|nr:hypothetical protein [Xylographa pallens]
MFERGFQAPYPHIYPFQQPNIPNPLPVGVSYLPPQVQHLLHGGGPQASLAPSFPFQQRSDPNPLALFGSYLPPQAQYHTSGEGAHAQYPPVSFFPQNASPNALMVTPQGQRPACLQKNPVRPDFREQCPQKPPMRQINGSKADLISKTKIPPSVPKKLDYASFSAADMRYCSIPYSPDPKEPEPLFPVRHRITVPSSPWKLSWFEWVNRLPLPHIFRRELRRIEWLDIDVAQKGTSKKAQECLVTITIMVEELNSKGREVVDRLAGVLQAQGHENVRVELAVYWCSVVDEFPDEYMRELEKLMVDGLTEFLGH